MLELVASPAQRKFGDDKRDTLTAQCRGCKVLNWCNGGCPKDRFALSRDGEPGQNYLCPGLELFFTHTGPTFNVMVQLLRQGRPPADVMASVAAEDDPARGLPALPLRQRQEVPLLPRRQGAGFGLQPGRSRTDGGARAVDFFEPGRCDAPRQLCHH